MIFIHTKLSCTIYLHPVSDSTSLLGQIPWCPKWHHVICREIDCLGSLARWPISECIKFNMHTSMNYTLKYERLVERWRGSAANVSDIFSIVLQFVTNRQPSMHLLSWKKNICFKLSENEEMSLSYCLCCYHNIIALLRGVIFKLRIL